MFIITIAGHQQGSGWRGARGGRGLIVGWDGGEKAERAERANKVGDNVQDDIVSKLLANGHVI